MDQRERIWESVESQPGLAKALRYSWEFWARPNQLTPKSDPWLWLLMTGRGFGKTWTGAHWTNHRARQGNQYRNMALIGYDPDEARDVMVKGPSGILSICPPWDQPKYEPSKRSITWSNGARAKIFSSEDPEELRGFSGDSAWLDEPAKYKHLDTVWSNLLFGLREGKVGPPRIVMTTTPKPRQLFIDLMKQKDVVVTGGSSYENPHLDPEFRERVLSKYENTQLGQQEIYGKLLSEMEGALWRREWVDHREIDPQTLNRIVVGVDPPGGERTECGIVCAGSWTDPVSRRDHLWVLGDYSVKGSPDVWGRKAVQCYKDFRADRLIAETNYGGKMVSHTIKTIDPNVAVKEVQASRGKKPRAEPVSALYEQGRGHHVKVFEALEDELCQWEPESQPAMPSPNRLDAMVWAATDLIGDDIGQMPQPVSIVGKSKFLK